MSEGQALHFLPRMKSLSLRSPLCPGRKLEAPEVHHLWELGRRGVWPHRLCRIRRGRWITLTESRSHHRDGLISFFFSFVVVVVTPHVNVILSVSFPQQYVAKLSGRAVAYINVDIAVFGKKLRLPQRQR